MKSIFSKNLDRIPSSGIRKFFDLVLESKDIISLGVGEPDFETPWQIRQTAIKSIEQGYTSYTSNSGLSSLLTEISHYQKNQFNNTYQAASEILITNGVSEGADLVFRSLLNAGDEVILPEPNYVCYSALIQLTGAKVKIVDTTKTQFIPYAEQIEKVITKKTKALVLCSPNNPTGATIPKTELIKLLALAKKYQFWIISDEIYAALSYNQSYTSCASLKDAKNYTILLNGFSKAYAMTGWRIGYICAPNDVISRCLKIHQYSALCSPITAQYAALEALKSGKNQVEAMKKSYLSRRNIMVKRFQKIGLDITLPTGAFYAFPSIKKTKLTSEAFAMALLKNQKVAVVPGTAFGNCAEGYIRCCYATNTNDLIEALDRIETFVKELK